MAAEAGERLVLAGKRRGKREVRGGGVRGWLGGGGHETEQKREGFGDREGKGLVGQRKRCWRF